MVQWLIGLRQAFASPAPFLSWIMLTVLLAVSGPFGTYVHLPLRKRFVVFAVLVGVSIAWGVCARTTVQRWIPSLGFWAASFIVIAVSAVALAFPIRAFSIYLISDPGFAPPPSVLVAVLIATFGLSAATLRWSMSREGVSQNPRQTASGPPADPLAPKLLDRLPVELRGKVIRISGSNHYVEVVTDKGTARLLIRLSDAISELKGVYGAQVHRSHWVAADAVRGEDRAGPKRLLVLSDGSRIPVSRNFETEAQELVTA
jgi:LytTr DNA-binding domain